MRTSKLMLALAIAGFSTASYATNGMVSHGIGIKSKGMGGVGTAHVAGAMSGASNPASMAVVGKGMDLGLDVFAPDRSTSITGNGAGFNMAMSANEDSNFLVPEFAYNTMLDANKSLGVVIYGNGGMNTSYPGPISAFGTSNAGIDLAQMFIAPTFAMKLNDQHSLGVSLNLAYQRFKANGLENFNNAAQSSAPGSVTNNSYDDSMGFGARIGWLGQMTNSVNVGAFYQTKTNMSKFDKYKGLFAEQGDLDVPSMYGIGISVKATPSTTIALDLQQINYTDVKAMSNSLGPVNAFGVLTNTLGTSNGAGFGWRDMTVVKIGIEHQLNNNIALRAGWNVAQQPIPNQETFFNLLAPGVVEQHLTLGMSWKTGGGEWNVSYMHAFENEVKGSGSIPTAFGLGEANLRMSQDALGVSYSWKM